VRTDGLVEIRMDDDEVRSTSGAAFPSCCSSALRRSNSRSRDDAIRAKELFRRHAEMMSATTLGTNDGKVGSSRRIAAVVAEPPLPNGGVPTTIS
jgi:hypothetical protein